MDKTHFAMESINDKLSLQNLLFKKAMPNYLIPVPINGHKVYSCIDCGDKFILDSSYEHHIERKSLKITYFCRYCNQTKKFFNRCNLLAHIRTHAFKTATINVSDLKMEPLPSIYFMGNTLSSEQPRNCSVSQSSQLGTVQTGKNKIVCSMCDEDITVTGTLFKDRAKHFMRYTNEVHSCPICLFSLPTICGLKIHLRLHTQHPPYYCPECGVTLGKNIVVYPYNHDCEGFRMMRATTRVRCDIKKCNLIHPNDYKQHLIDNHLKKVYKCTFCYVACFEEALINKHLKTHKTHGDAMIFYQCAMCPGRLVLQNQIHNHQIHNHLKSHLKNIVYPCWSCGTIFVNILLLIRHHMKQHGLQKMDEIWQSVDPIITNFENASKTLTSTTPKRIYRVVKRCEQCKKCFTYKCRFEQIYTLPDECPYKCSFKHVSNEEEKTDAQITCSMCEDQISQNWDEIKIHYNLKHKTHRCLDAKLIVKKLDIEQWIMKQARHKQSHANFTKSGLRKRSRNRARHIIRSRKQTNFVSNLTENHIDSANELSTLLASSVNSSLRCNKCGYEGENRETLETHLISHRDPCMAYQCMECGQCFVVKPSFSTHLMLDHGITDVQDYINKKNCYNENALLKYQDNSSINEPIRENQCRICREQFDNSYDLQKHFRVHGMAFLMKNNSNKSNSP